MTNVLLVTQRFYPPWSDGTVSYARGLVDAISETCRLGKDLEVTVLSLTEKTWFPKLHREEMKEYLEKRPINLEWFSTSEKGQQTHLWKLVRRLSRTKDYDLIHIVYLGLNPLFIRMGIDNKHRNLIAKHLFIFPFHSGFTAEKLAYNFFRKSGVFQQLNVDLVFSSKVLQKMYGAGGTTVLPPAIDTNFYSPRSKSNGSCRALMESVTKFGNASNVLQRDVVALYMGPLSHERFDWKNVIGGFTKLCKEYGVNAGLVIVGRGFESLSFLEEIKDHIYKNNLSDRVFLCLKDLSETEKICLFNDTHVFIYPFSRKLSHMSVVFPPIALLESMSAGLCVVSGGLPYLNSLIKNHENGILLEGDINEKSFAEGIWNAINSKRNLSQNARLTIRRNFSIKRVSELYADFLSKTGI